MIKKFNAVQNLDIAETTFRNADEYVLDENNNVYHSNEIPLDTRANKIM